MTTPSKITLQGTTDLTTELCGMKYHPYPEEVIPCAACEEIRRKKGIPSKHKPK